VVAPRLHRVSRAGPDHGLPAEELHEGEEVLRLCWPIAERSDHHCGVGSTLPWRISSATTEVSSTLSPPASGPAQRGARRVVSPVDALGGITCGGPPRAARSRPTGSRPVACGRRQTAVVSLCHPLPVDRAEHQGWLTSWQPRPTGEHTYAPRSVAPWTCPECGAPASVGLRTCGRAWAEGGDTDGERAAHLGAADDGALTVTDPVTVRCFSRRRALGGTQG
jgi:hypothetical protein